MLGGRAGLSLGGRKTAASWSADFKLGSPLADDGPENKPPGCNRGYGDVAVALEDLPGR